MKNYSSTREFLLDNLAFIRGRTLDLGAGKAKYKGLFLQKTSDYLAFDKFKNENIDHVGDVHITGFPDKSFDTVVCTQVLEHVEQPFKVAAEIERILKPGGTCIVTAPFIYPFHPEPTDYFRFTKEGLEKIFAEMGMKIVKSGKYGSTISVLASFIKGKYFILPKNHNKIILKLFGYLIDALYQLDAHFQPNIIYDNVYIIADKTKI